MLTSSSTHPSLESNPPISKRLIRQSAENMLNPKNRNAEIMKSNTIVEREHLLYFQIPIFITNTTFMYIPISRSKVSQLALKKEKVL